MNAHLHDPDQPHTRFRDSIVRLADVAKSRSILFRHLLTQPQRVRVLLDEMADGLLDGPYTGMPHGLAYWWDARSIFYRRFPTRQNYCRKILWYLRKVIYTHALEALRAYPKHHKRMDNKIIRTDVQIMAWLRALARRPPRMTGSARFGAAIVSPQFGTCLSSCIRAEVAMRSYGRPMGTFAAFEEFRLSGMPPHFVQTGNRPIYRPFDLRVPLPGRRTPEHDTTDEEDERPEEFPIGRDYW